MSDNSQNKTASIYTGDTRKAAEYFTMAKEVSGRQRLKNIKQSVQDKMETNPTAHFIYIKIIRIM